MIEVLIVDDHPLIRKGLKQILVDESDIAVTGEASDVHEVMEILRKKKFDLVLLDISLKNRSGMDLLPQLKSEYPRMPVLVLSMFPEDQYAVRVLRAGAAGYVTKESAPTQLVDAIRKTASGGKFVSPLLAEKLASALETGFDDLPHKTLSDREFEVLTMIGSGKTVTEIAELLSLSVKTITTYRARILEKMGMKNNAQLVSYVYKHNLLE